MKWVRVIVCLNFMVTENPSFLGISQVWCFTGQENKPTAIFLTTGFVLISAAS